MDKIHDNERVPSPNNDVEGSHGPSNSEKDVYDVDYSPEAIGAQQVNLDHIDAREERAFLWRLDLGFLTIGFLGYMFKYLDQINISNAYVSGMQEDLNLTGNELNYFTTYFK